jgi:hypothetical protein
MDHHVSIIQQYPSGLRRAFFPKRFDALMFQGFQDGIGDGFDLPGTLSGANDEVIGKTTNILGI